MKPSTEQQLGHLLVSLGPCRRASLGIDVGGRWMCSVDGVEVRENQIGLLSPCGRGNSISEAVDGFLHQIAGRTLKVSGLARDVLTLDLNESVNP